MTIKISKEFIIYCIVGMINTLVGTGTAIICLNLFLLQYSVATTMSYITGIIVSFFLNKKYTFKNKDKSLKQFIKFFLSMLPTYVASYWLGYQIAHFSAKYLNNIVNDFAQRLNISQIQIIDNIAIILSMAIYLIVGFAINKFFVFKNKKEI